MTTNPPALPAEPEWIAFGDGWFRLKGTNWTVRPQISWRAWEVFCGEGCFDDCLNLDDAKLSALELRRLMAEEPTP